MEKPPVNKQSPNEKLKCNLQLNDLSSEQYQRIEKACHDPKFSSYLFLQSDQSLKEVITKDLKTLGEFGITCRQISDRLKYLIKASQSVKSSQKLTVKPKFLRPSHWMLHSVSSAVVSDQHGTYEVHIGTFNGAQKCPFHKESSAASQFFDFEYGAQDVILVNYQTKEQFYFSTLLPHLIKRHAFFEGTGLTYRIEPEVIIQFLQLVPGVNYKVPRVTLKTWEFLENSSLSEDDPFDKITRRSPVLVHQSATFYLSFGTELNSLLPPIDEEEERPSYKEKNYLLARFGKTLTSETREKPRKPAAVVNADVDYAFLDPEPSEEDLSEERPSLQGLLLVEDALINLEEIQYGSLTIFELVTSRELPSSYLYQEYLRVKNQP